MKPSEVQDYDIDTFSVLPDETENDNEQSYDTKDAVPEPDTKRQQTNEKSKEFLEEGRIYFFYRYPNFASCFLLLGWSIHC